jgi:broad specificity phosphatase PhoE
MNFDEIYIESSPFLRCLQTASRIAEKLRVKKVEVNWLITEHLGDI